ncbi:peptidoglycan/LPS O-acetylase OafA/YrhL [Sphingobium sp. B11D3B]|uniref:acyltransferase family protein n=1 Tax=Sphingobium sp. B11D3B TaxID=2940575 RepID=UPI0022277C39|nr:acyltransferase [Sphingobium sp. B11D3B]MCW2387040.1 peptidoglycan/LPS O-acetylase OafA/YrhL [Sphingobium sp. B11D3B]
MIGAGARRIAALFAPPERTSGHFLLIDAMRGVAALVIIFWHYQHFFYPPGAERAMAGFRPQQPFFEEASWLYEHGKYAVQLFWVISGFVFAHVYHGRKSSTRDFVVNRLARLYPLHVLTLLIVAGLQGIAQAKFGAFLVYQHNTLGNFLLHLGLASNWWPTVVYSFNAPIWSVSIEILVYALFWLSLPVLFRAGVLGPALLAAGAIAGCFLFEGYILFMCAAGFFGGAALFAVHANRAIWLSVLVVLLLGAGGWTSWDDSLDIRRYLSVPLFSMAIVLLAALLEPCLRATLLQRTRWLGDASYGIYLWHFPVQLVLLLAVPRLATDHQLAREPAFFLMFMTSVVIIAVLSFRLFETPSRRWLRARLEARPHPPASSQAAP